MRGSETFQGPSLAAQEEALKVKTLREVQPLIEEVLAGPKGGVSNACIAAVEQHLHEGSYSTSELERQLGTLLRELFQGNASQMRVLEIAESAGMPPLEYVRNALVHRSAVRSHRIVRRTAIMVCLIS